MLQTIQQFRYWCAQHDIPLDGVEVVLRFPPADIEARARYALQNELMVSTYWPSVVEISGAELCGVRVRFTSGFNA